MCWLSFAAGIAFSAVVLLPVACVILAALGTHEARRLADKMPSAPRPADETPVFHATQYADEVQHGRS